MSLALDSQLKYGTLVTDKVNINKLTDFDGKPRIIQNSCEFHGFYYAILVDLNDERKKNSLLHGNSLLLPFSLAMWILLIFSILLVSLQLYLSKTRDAIFFTVATLLEQGDDGSRKKNRRNFFIIFVWLFVTCCLRNAYNSCMYSYITAEKTPKVPASFREIVAKNDYPIVGEHHEMSMFVIRASARSNHFNYFDQLVGGRIIGFSLLRDHDGDIQWKNKFTQRQLSSYTSYQSVEVERMYVLNFSDLDWSPLRYKPKELLSLSEFAYVYSYLPIVGLRRTGFSQIYAVVAFGGRRVFWNNDEPFLSVLMGYKGASGLNSKLVDEIFGILKHSGLWSYWRETYTFVSIAKHLKSINEKVLNSGKSWDFVNLATTMVSDMTRVKAGLDIGQSLGSQKMQIELLSVVWVLHAGLCSICVITFLVELSWHFVLVLVPKFLCIMSQIRILMITGYRATIKKF
ncbi:unnamed protein product [Orchesella dallaii]|uniref:Ionotropic glutamate receptor C-terminal domain-containing protein n=1 Tax=Orchesella dallaii TaxID=48710 RepID=A0ABP1PX69_9HEXA